MERIICIVIGYVFGLFQTGYIYGRIHHIDIRKHGSGNAGTTNALRTLGWKAGLITFFGDCVKCVLAVVLVRIIFAESDYLPLLSLYAGLGAVLGHNYPFYLNFKGGKGIAATGGLILAINPIMFLTLLGVFLIILLTTQYVSLGSLAVSVLFVVEMFIYGHMGGFQLEQAQLYELYGLAIVLAIMAIFRHRENIKRLLKGTENKTNIRKVGKK